MLQSVAEVITGVWLVLKPSFALAWPQSPSPGPATINLCRPPRPRAEMQALGPAVAVAATRPLAPNRRGRGLTRCGTRGQSACRLSVHDRGSILSGARRGKPTRRAPFLASPYLNESLAL